MSDVLKRQTQVWTPQQRQKAEDPAAGISGRPGPGVSLRISTNNGRLDRFVSPRDQRH